VSSPLQGKRILVTRPRGQASALADRLREVGAVPIQLPAIEIAPPKDFTPIDNALHRLSEFEWVIMTSVNGIAAVAGRLDTLGLARECLSQRKIAVIGPATAEACAKAFRQPDVVPGQYISDAIADAIGEIGDHSFLLLRADIARKDLPEELTRRGGKVEEVAVYRIVSDESVKLGADEPAPDYITLTSSASVHATLAKLREANREEWMRKVPLACIGPITARTVDELGYRVAVEAKEYTIGGLVEALIEHAKETVHA
jgi:uroporphyrinogen-III synthase